MKNPETIKISCDRETQRLNIECVHGIGCCFTSMGGQIEEGMLLKYLGQEEGVIFLEKVDVAVNQKSLQFEYDEYKDELIIEGNRFSDSFFRRWNTLGENKIVRFLKKENGAIWLQEIEKFDSECPIIIKGKDVVVFKPEIELSTADRVRFEDSCKRNGVKAVMSKVPISVEAIIRDKK